MFSIYYSFWHQGVLFLIWIFTLWLSFAEERNRIDVKSYFYGIIKYLVWAGIGIVFVFNIYWSVIISLNDYKKPYSAGKEVADFIKGNHLENKNIYAGNFWSVSILPYFEKNIFRAPCYNRGCSYWVWSKNYEYPEDTDVIIKKKPDVIIFGRPEMFKCPDKIAGYRLFRFTGFLFWKDTIKNVLEYKVFLRAGCSL
ncbi:MAG: hypothetical protein HY958_00145 [Bacteroidia bacterium]|nr:hypothetical protein [Bacteroidia bacterium]